MLPEIIDSRLERKMEVREPSYLIEAIKKREAEGQSKKRKSETIVSYTEIRKRKATEK